MSFLYRRRRQAPRPPAQGRQRDHVEEAEQNEHLDNARLRRPPDALTARDGHPPPGQLAKPHEQAARPRSMTRLSSPVPGSTVMASTLRRADEWVLARPLRTPAAPRDHPDRHTRHDRSSSLPDAAVRRETGCRRRVSRSLHERWRSPVSAWRLAVFADRWPITTSPGAA